MNNCSLCSGIHWHGFLAHLKPNTPSFSSANSCNFTALLFLSRIALESLVPTLKSHGHFQIFPFPYLSDKPGPRYCLSIRRLSPPFWSFHCYHHASRLFSLTPATIFHLALLVSGSFCSNSSYPPILWPSSSFPWIRDFLIFLANGMEP